MTVDFNEKDEFGLPVYRGMTEDEFDEKLQEITDFSGVDFLDIFEMDSTAKTDTMDDVMKGTGCSRPGCDRGKIYTAQGWITCPECEKRRQDLLYSSIRNNQDVMGLSQEVLTEDFDFSKALSLDSQRFLKPESIERVKEGINMVQSALLLGEDLPYSVMFNLGSHAKSKYLCDFFIKRAFQGALKVAPLLDDLRLLKVEENTMYEDRQEWGSSMFHYMDADVVVLHLLSGSNPDRIAKVRGFLQGRANYGKSTIIVTDRIPDGALQTIMSNDMVQSKAYMYSVEYKSKAEIKKLVESSIEGYTMPNITVGNNEQNELLETLIESNQALMQSNKVLVGMIEDMDRILTGIYSILEKREESGADTGVKQPSNFGFSSKSRMQRQNATDFGVY